MSDISVADVRRGDLLLVTHLPGNALADLILELDRSPDEFTHCGVALGDGAVLSALLGFELRLPLDLGGLHVDCFEHFWDLGQHISRIAVTDADRDRARAALPRFLPPQGSFSVPKIVMVAATLHALAPENAIEPEAKDRVVRAAVAAARAWAGDGDYYCAEFVADAYGWTFTLDELVPPKRETLVWAPLAQLVVNVVEAILTLDRPLDQRATLHSFVAEVRACDPEFFEHGLRAVVDTVLRRAPEEVRHRAAELTEQRAGVASLLPPDTELPSVLVTPRMLLGRHRGDGAPPVIARSPTPCHEQEG